jgi:hypothetical protein
MGKRVQPHHRQEPAVAEGALFHRHLPAGRRGRDGARIRQQPLHRGVAAQVDPFVKSKGLN